MLNSLSADVCATSRLPKTHQQRNCGCFDHIAVWMKHVTWAWYQIVDQFLVQFWERSSRLGRMTDETDAFSVQSITVADQLLPRSASRLVPLSLSSEASLMAFAKVFPKCRGCTPRKLISAGISICHGHSSSAADRYGKIKAQGRDNQPVIVAGFRKSKRPPWYAILWDVPLTTV